MEWAARCTFSSIEPGGTLRTATSRAACRCPQLNVHCPWRLPRLKSNHAQGPTASKTATPPGQLHHSFIDPSGAHRENHPGLPLWSARHSRQRRWVGRAGTAASSRSSSGTRVLARGDPVHCACVRRGCRETGVLEVPVSLRAQTESSSACAGASRGRRS